MPIAKNPEIIIPTVGFLAANREVLISTQMGQKMGQSFVGFEIDCSLAIGKNAATARAFIQL